MSCTICSIKNEKLKKAIELCLTNDNGILTPENRLRLKSLYPENTAEIDNVTDTDCTNHFNFHYTQAREPELPTAGKTDTKSASLTADINKDEANILYELANTQVATFNLLTNRMNEALQNSEDEMSSTILHPTAVQLYRETAESIRSTVELIKELNSSINGSADSALEGLKALAGALHPSSIDRATADDEDNEMTTDKFDY